MPLLSTFSGASGFGKAKEKAPVWVSQTVSTAMTVGTAYTNTVSATGARSYFVSSGSLPGGLSLNPATGVLSGTPTTSGAFSFKIGARSRDGLFVETATISGSVAKPSVTILNYASPSPQTLTGGVNLIKGNASWPSASVNSDHIRINWPAWSDGQVLTNNTFNLTGCTRYEAEVDTVGMNSAYGYFSIEYPNSSGGFNNPYNYPRATAKQTYNVNLNGTPGTGQIKFNGGNTFGDVKIYRLQFFYD